MPGNSARSPKGGPPRWTEIATWWPAPRAPLHRRSPASLPHRSRAPLRLALLALGCLAAPPGCAPTVETPGEAGHRRDLRDAARIAAQLRHLPMVLDAGVTLTRAVEDPLRDPAPPPPPSASVVLALDARAAPGALDADARALVAAVAPEVPAASVTVLARPVAPPPVLARLGPFEVARASRTPLLAALLGLLALCAGLGSALALRERARRAASASAP